MVGVVEPFLFGNRYGIIFLNIMKQYITEVSYEIGRYDEDSGSFIV